MSYPIIIDQETFFLLCPSSVVGLEPNIANTLYGSISSIILSKTLTSHFQVNSTIADILYALAIEDWNEKIDYTLYYNHCKPVNCFYAVTKKFNIPSVITTVIGLIGGFSVILDILIPPIIKFLRRHRRIRLSTVTTSRQG